MKRQRAQSPPTGSLLPARIETTAGAVDRLRERVRAGANEFVLTSRDGAMSAFVRLSVEPPSTSQHRIGGRVVIVDWAESTIARDRRCVCLSRTELKLLASLLERPGEVHLRLDLIARVWPADGLDPGARENALTVYVCGLRKRLSTLGVGAALTTVRGKGYRILSTSPRDATT